MDGTCTGVGWGSDRIRGPPGCSRQQSGAGRWHTRQDRAPKPTPQEPRRSPLPLISRSNMPSSGSTRTLNKTPMPIKAGQDICSCCRDWSDMPCCDSACHSMYCTEDLLSDLLLCWRFSSKKRKKKKEKKERNRLVLPEPTQTTTHRNQTTRPTRVDVPRETAQPHGTAASSG